MDQNKLVSDLLESCDYEPIDHYAVIGDCRSAALVSRTGSLDWLCLPDFSSSSIFAALLDRRRGGRFLIRPRDIQRVERRYLGRSAVLETTFHCVSGVVALVDFMPMPVATDRPQRLFRKARCIEGQVAVDVIYQPRPDYGRVAPALECLGPSGWALRQDGTLVLLWSDAPLFLTGEDTMVGGTCFLAAGQQQRFLLAYGQEPADFGSWLGPEQADEAGTVDWWEAWCGGWLYDGPHPEAVMRSCLTLKLLTCLHSGAVIAALTTSLPESMESSRNWDYRYCWLRDTSLLLQSFVDLGFQQESEAFLGWLLKVGRQPGLQPLYDLRGQPVPDEVVLPHLEGYRGQGPVRIGNCANRQLQLDIYGELVQTAYRFVARGGRLNDGEKLLLAGLGEAVCRLWRQPDQSIWETRGPPRHYTYSKLMCWVALDRLISLNQTISLGVDEEGLRRERDSIRRDIDSQGFNPELGSYVGYFGGTDPDASLLLMVRYGYLDPHHPRIRATYRYIVDRLSVAGFLYRYPPGEAYDGVPGGENLFAVCSFWVVDYLARAGELEEALELFERLLGLANDVGLYSEQFDVRTGQALGNFPQAFTHSGLITAALAMGQALKGRRGHQIPT